MLPFLYPHKELQLQLIGNSIQIQRGIQDAKVPRGECNHVTTLWVLYEKYITKMSSTYSIESIVTSWKHLDQGQIHKMSYRSDSRSLALTWAFIVH